MALSRYTFIGFAIGIISFAGLLASSIPDVAKKPVIIGLFLLLGTMALLAVLIQNRRIKYTDDATAIIPWQVFGTICRENLDLGSEEILPGMWKIRQNLEGWLEEPGKQIVIISADPEDGKTILATALAMELVQSDRLVTLVDANLQRPALTNIFAGHSISKNLKLIGSSRSAKPNSLDRAEFRLLLEDRRLVSDVVLYDGSATADNIECLSLLSPNIYVIVVIRLGHTMVRSLELLAAQLSHREIADGALVIFGGAHSAPVAEIPMAAPIYTA
jgi:hypothetical protein